MVKKPYSKEYLYAEISDFLEHSCVLRGKNLKSIFTVNELLYCMESIQWNVSNLNLQINTIEGIYIPCYKEGPYFVDTNTRSKKVVIRNLEVYDANEEDNDEDQDWVYLLIIEEVKGE